MPPKPSRKNSTTPHYQTFPTQPPKTRGPPLTDSETRYNGSGGESRDDAGSTLDTPLPKKQLLVLAVIALCEQTALNSISPYLPEMASEFPEVNVRKVGLYVGLIASAFALAQFATNFFWGWFSDRVGRKPIILFGTLSTAACFLAFGFCKTLWQAVVVQIFMGLLNGNQGVVSTCLGEITDKSNQSQAFAYLPVIYGIGGITGPLLGGMLVGWGPEEYPFLAPNILATVLLVIDAVVIMIFMDETLEQAQQLRPLSSRLVTIFSYVWQVTTFGRPGSLRTVRQKGSSQDEGDALLVEDDTRSISSAESGGFGSLIPGAASDFDYQKHVLNKNTLLLLATYLIFQLSNISYNSLYPIFAQAPIPAGRNLSPEEIGLSLAFAGLVTIGFQIGIFGKLREKLGNKATYRVGLGGFVIAFILMPFVGYKHAEDAGLDGGIAMSSGRVALWIELGVVLLIKTVATVGGLTSALLLITNSAPSHSVLGTLNGLAQTLSAAGRAIGPFISGGLFSIAAGVQPKGEAIAFGTFGGIAFIGFLLSFGITGGNLEAEGWEENAGEGENSDDEGSDDGESGRHGNGHVENGQRVKSSESSTTA